MIKFENVVMRYGKGPEILNNVSFSLNSGAFQFLTGTSGAGKSSLLKLIYLAHRPSQGKITAFDQDLSKLSDTEIPALRRRIGIVFQDFRLLNHLSSFDNVALPLRIKRVNEFLIYRHVTELLTWVGLAQQINAKPPTLSGGQKQRVAIARAVISRPHLLLADEPTGNVDDTIALRLIYLLEEMNRQGTTIMIATHNESLIQRFKYPVMRIDNGAVIKERAIDRPPVNLSPKNNETSP